MTNEQTNVAFIGNPNCGKTTLFNAYTGAKLKVANWAGVTVEKKEGVYKFHDNKFKLVDLPRHIQFNFLFHGRNCFKTIYIRR